MFSDRIWDNRRESVDRVSSTAIAPVSKAMRRHVFDDEAINNRRRQLEPFVRIGRRRLKRLQQTKMLRHRRRLARRWGSRGAHENARSLRWRQVLRADSYRNNMAGWRRRARNRRAIDRPRSSGCTHDGQEDGGCGSNLILNRLSWCRRGPPDNFFFIFIYRLGFFEH